MASLPWYQKFATALVPGANLFFAPPTVKEPSKADMQRALAYVDPSRLTASWAISPYNPSWLVTRKGLQIYDAMKRDEQVKAALKFKTDSVLASGWEVVSPGDQKEDWEVTRFAKDALDFVPGGWNLALTNILSALAYGFSISERVYDERVLGEWKGKLVLSRVQSIKPHYIDFLTDEFGVLKGVVQQLTGHSNDPLPPAKFILYAHAREFGNYYGTSDLEAAYRPYWVKDNAYKWLAITLERYGMAPLFAMYDPNAYQGNMVEELKKIVKNIQSTSMGVIPRSSKDALEFWSQNLNKGSSELFLAGIDRFDQHIARAILVPELLGMSSNTGQTGSLARSQTNAGSFLQVILQLQQSIAGEVMNAQVIPQLCDLNFPSLQSYPVFRFLPMTDEKRLEIITAWASLVGGQVVNKIEDDEVHIRKVLGFPDNENPEVLPNPQPPGGGGLSKAGLDGKKPNPFEKKKFEQDDVAEVPFEEQSEEMRAFAEDNDAVWVGMEDGQRVAVDYAEWDESEHPRDPGGEGGGQFVPKSRFVPAGERGDRVWRRHFQGMNIEITKKENKFLVWTDGERDSEHEKLSDAKQYIRKNITVKT